MKVAYSKQERPGPALLLIILAVTAVVIGVPQLLYGSVYSVHQDLAGSALSGRLANTLGASFGDYSIYFPPAERAWFSLAACLSDLTGTRLDLTVVAMTSAAVLFSTSLAFSIRRRTVGASPLFLIIPAALLLFLPMVFKNIFGLREHMVVLGLWPYLVLRVSDPRDTQVGWKTRLVLGVWLGATLLFKYLYALVVLLVELADAAIQRRFMALFRIENLVAGGIVALYLFLWLVLHPSQREAIGMLKSAIDANLIDARSNLLTFLIRLPLAVYFIAGARVFKWPLRETLFGLALLIGSMVVAAIQARWYSHHVYPITMAYIAWWWMLGRRIQWWGHLAVALLIVMPVIPQYRMLASYQEETDEIAQAMEEEGISVEGKRVGMLAVHPSPYNEYFAAHGAWRWNASANNSYVASALQDFDTRENRGLVAPPVTLTEPGRVYLHDEMLRLWEDMPPDALILDNKKNWPLRHAKIDWLQAFSQDTRFNAIMADYEPVFVHKGERLEFTYYVRKGD